MIHVVLTTREWMRRKLFESLEFTGNEITFVSSLETEPLSRWNEQQIVLIADMTYPNAREVLTRLNNSNSIVLAIVSIGDGQEKEIEIVRSLHLAAFVTQHFHPLELRAMIKRLLT